MFRGTPKANFKRIIVMIYDQLPVFKETYDLLLYFYKLNKNFQREYRYSLAENIKKEIISIIIEIYKANAGRDKAIHISSALDYLVSVKIQMRLLKDLKQISISQFSQIVLKEESISKQLNSWRKSHVQF